MANIPRVCKHFRDLMNAAMMWKSFGSLDDFGCLKYNKQMFDNLLDRHGHQFRKLYFNGEFRHLLAQVSLDYVYGKLSLCCNLKVLDLTSNMIVEEIPFIANMPNLERIFLEWCTQLIPESVTTSLCEDCPKLKQLSLRKCKQFDESEIINIVFSHKSLEILDISDTKTLNVKSATAMCAALSHLKEFGFSANLYENSIGEWLHFENIFSFICFDF